MSTKTHLVLEDRKQIEVMLNQRQSFTSIAKNLGKNGRRIALEMCPRPPDAALIGIGEDGVASFHDFHPFGLGPEDDARLLEEISFLLHSP